MIANYLKVFVGSLSLQLLAYDEIQHTNSSVDIIPTWCTALSSLIYIESA